MTAILGRMCTYSGKEITWDEAINSKINLLPDELSFDATPKSSARRQRTLSAGGARLDQGGVAQTSGSKG